MNLVEHRRRWATTPILCHRRSRRPGGRPRGRRCRGRWVPDRSQAVVAGRFARLARDRQRRRGGDRQRQGRGPAGPRPAPGPRRRRHDGPSPRCSPDRRADQRRSPRPGDLARAGAGRASGRPADRGVDRAGVVRRGRGDGRDPGDHRRPGPTGRPRPTTVDPQRRGASALARDAQQRRDLRPDGACLAWGRWPVGARERVGRRARPRSRRAAGRRHAWPTSPSSQGGSWAPPRC